MRTRTSGECRRTTRIWTVCALALATALAGASAQATEVPEVTVDLASRGAVVAHEAGNGGSYFGLGVRIRLISADGRYVVFTSQADNLVPNENTVRSDIFRYDSMTDTVELVSVNSAGTGSGNGNSQKPSISADGMRVAFESSSSDLDPLDSNTTYDVFVRDFTTGTTRLVSMNAAGTGSGLGLSQSPCISADGSRVAFQSNAPDLNPMDTDTVVDVFVRDLDTDTTYLASVNAAGTGSGNGQSAGPVLSDNGIRVCFQSQASNLHAADTDTTADVFVRDLDTGTTYLASVNTAGTGSGNGSSVNPVINADGSRVAFQSTATNLHALDTDTYSDIFLRDVDAGTTYLLSQNTAGSASANRDCYEPSISDDGMRVAYSSSATNLNAMDTDTYSDIFVRDLGAGTTYLASVNSAGTGSANYTCLRPYISNDGTHVSFLSSATNLHASVTTNTDVFVRDLVGGSTLLASAANAGAAGGNGQSSTPMLSADGAVVTFVSLATNLTTRPDAGSMSDVFVHDAGSGTTLLASVADASMPAATSALGQCTFESTTTSGPFSPVSADGRYVVFQTQAANLVANDTNYALDVFRYDRQTGVVDLVSVNTAGTGPGNGASSAPTISADGSRVAFQSYASDLHALDTDGLQDIFVRDIDAGVTYLASVDSAGTGSADSDCGEPFLCANGSRVAFTTGSTNLHSLDASTYADVYVRDVDAGVTYLASTSSGATSGSNSSCSDPMLNAAGTRVSFISYGTNLHSLATTIQMNVFVRDLTSNSTFLVNVNRDGTGASAAKPLPVISADGKRVAFSSTATNLHALDTDSVEDVFVRDLDAGVTYLASVNKLDNGSGNQASKKPVLDADGTHVAFESTATNLHALPTLNHSQIYVRDLDGGITHLASVSWLGDYAGFADSFSPAISADGKRVAFESKASNLHPQKGGALTDIIVRDLSRSKPYLMSPGGVQPGMTSGNYLSERAAISADGTGVAFQSYATNLLSTLTTGYDLDIFLATIGATDLKVEIAESADPVTANSGAGNLVYTVTVSNIGSVDSTGVSLETGLTLPAGVALDSVVPSGSTGFAADVWTVGDLDSGDSETLTFTLTVADAASAGTDLVQLQAQLASVAEGDLDADNNSDVEKTSIFRDVDLDVDVAESADPVAAGSGAENLTYTVTVTNLGDSTANGVTLDVTKTLPTGVTLDSSSASGSTSYDGSVWHVGALASGDTETLYFYLTVASNAAAGTDVISAQAEVATVNETDGAAGNDSDSEATSIARQSDLAVTKLDDGVYAAPAKVTVYTVSVENFGPSDAANVVITETVPAGTVYSAAESEAGWNVSGTGEAGDTCTLNAGSLAVGASVDAAFAVLVADPLSGVSGQIENTASAASDSTEASEGDESDTIDTYLLPHPIDDIDGDGIPNDEDPDDDGDGVKDERDPDRDGDGVNNDLDDDPDDPTVVGPGGLPGVAGLSVKKLLVRLDFDDAGKDKISASGIFILPANFTPNGTVVDVDVGGQTQSFTLDEKGKSLTGTDTFKIKASRKPNPDGTFNAKWALQLKKGTFVVNDVNDVVFDGSNSGEEDRVLRMTLNVAGADPELRYNVGTVVYKSTDLKGSAKTKRQ